MDGIRNPEVSMSQEDAYRKPSRKLSSVEIGNYQRRHFTEKQGCVDPNYVEPKPVIDACAQVFANNTAAEYCSDPYFGGKPECCYDVQVSQADHL